MCYCFSLIGGSNSISNRFVTIFLNFFFNKQNTWTDYQCQERTSTTWNVANVITLEPFRVRSPTMPTRCILALQHQGKHNTVKHCKEQCLYSRGNDRARSTLLGFIGPSWLATPKYTPIVPVSLQADAGQLVYMHHLVLQKRGPSSFPMRSEILKVREPLRHMSKQNKGTPTDYKTRHKVADPSTGCMFSLSLGKGLFAWVKWLHAWFPLFLYSMRKKYF